MIALYQAIGIVILVGVASIFFYKVREGDGPSEWLTDAEPDHRQQAMERARLTTGANGVLLVVARTGVAGERWRLVLQAGLLGLAVAGFWTGPPVSAPVVFQNVVFLSLSIIALRLSVIGWHARRTIARLAAAEEEEGRG